MGTKTGVITPLPLLRSTEGPTTRPCRLRFVNNFLYPIDVFWIDHEGTEKKHATVQPKGQSPQGTYTTHAWRIRETSSGRLLGTYVGEEATVEMTSAAACLVHKGFNPGQAFGRKTYPSSWGKFTERAKVKQIPVRAFDCVSDKAISRAEHLLEKLLDGVPPGMLKRLHQNQADVAIVGRQQATCELPMHTFLESQDIESERSSCSNGARGVGGCWTVPTASTGEENLLMDEDDTFYPAESTLVHHFAHSIMAIAMNEDQRQAVISAYFNARARQLYPAQSAIVACADEYWAQGAQAWFDATVRRDVNGGINTREKLERCDPQLANLMEHAFGNNSWRFPHTAPAALSVRRHRNGDLAELPLLKLKARYQLCCLPGWLTYFWPSQCDKALEKLT